MLFLKHNLNPRVIGALRNELDTIERDSARLIEQMQKAIAEANVFIDSMESKEMINECSGIYSLNNYACYQ